MKRFLLIISVVMLAFSACQDYDSQHLTFVGDSIVARWDLQESFPSIITQNMGVSGTQIGYLEQLKGRFNGCDIVVLLGTNDCAYMYDHGVEAYAERYIRAIESLGADHVYLYSVLPRDFTYDLPEFPALIRNFNALVKERVQTLGYITYLDVHDLFLKPDKSLNMHYYAEGLHINAYGYEILARALKDVL